MAEDFSDGAKGGELYIFYNDDNHHVQGPYRASTVLKWVSDGFFDTHHLMRITDNGMRIGQVVTYEATFGELKALFGEKTPIPQKLKTLLEAGISGFHVKKQHFTLPEISIKKEEESIQRPELEIPYGPELPPALKKQRELVQLQKSSSQSSLKSDKSSRDESKKEISKDPSPNDSIGKVRSYSISSSTRADHPYSRKSKKTDEKRERDERHRPFYDGSSRRSENILTEVVAVEFGRILKAEYDGVAKTARDNIHSKCEKLWRLPKHCRGCDCELKMSANFLSHILSPGHIKKMMHGKSRVFTFQDDYIELKNLLSSSSTTRKNVLPEKPKNQPEGGPNEERDIKNSCTQS